MCLGLMAAAGEAERRASEWSAPHPLEYVVDPCDFATAIVITGGALGDLVVVLASPQVVRESAAQCTGLAGSVGAMDVGGEGGFGKGPEFLTQLRAEWVHGVAAAALGRGLMLPAGWAGRVGRRWED